MSNHRAVFGDMGGGAWAARRGGRRGAGSDWHCLCYGLSAALLLLTAPPGASAPHATGARCAHCSDARGGDPADASLRLRGGGIPKALPRWSDVSIPRVMSMKQVHVQRLQ